MNRATPGTGRRGTARFAWIFAIATVVLLATALPASAKYASYVIDADSGQVLHDVNADTRNYPASLTKMMTLYLTFEALNEGRLRLFQELPVSARAERQRPSRLGLRRGETIKVRDAILALVTKSANDVAVVVAEALAGSERKFAMRMTARARQLGMGSTTFRNASGLPNRGQLSTAHDMAVLGLALERHFPQYYDFFSTTEFTFRGETYKNHNNLLGKYEGVDGIKTGYIHASGFNLVTSVRRDGRHLIGVVFGGKTARARDHHMAKLLDEGFRLASASPQTAGERTVRVSTQRPKKAPPAATASRRPSSAGKGTWAVQVGAYYTFGPAYEAAQRAVSRAPSYLSGGEIKVMTLEKGSRTLYRARIVGIGKRDAYRACHALKKLKQGCMEVHLPDGVQVASSE